MNKTDSLVSRYVAQLYGDKRHMLQKIATAVGNRRVRIAIPFAGSGIDSWHLARLGHTVAANDIRRFAAVRTATMTSSSC